MAAIFPFSALRPVPPAARDVAAVPYDVVDREEAGRLASGNPLSFLHVSRAEIDLPPGTDPYSDDVYQRAAENLATLRANAPLVVEDRPRFYAYRLDMGSHAQSGIAACFSIDEYERGVIKKHEKTRPDKEDDRTRHMRAIRAQTGPVFLTYKQSPAVDAVVSRTEGAAPLFDFVADDGVRHRVWQIDAAENDRVVAAFAAIPTLYIADGHHRAASAARARSGGESDRVLAVAFPDNQMQILPYNRVVADLNGMSPDQFLTALAARARMRAQVSAAPKAKGEFSVYIDGRWHSAEFIDRPASGGVQALDVSLLQDRVLAPLLGIGDPRTDKRIDFVGGIRGTAELERLVNSEKFAVAFALYPTTIADLMHIADAGGIMPPKSTWFEPKLRDGLLSHPI